MPHQCTGCGHVFPDGSKEMLSGCPDCGGNKFQFQPAGATASSSGTDADASGSDGSAPAPPEDPPEPPEPPSPGGVAGTVAGATERVRDFVTSDDSGDHEWPASARRGARGGASSPAPAEDGAQASARSSVVERDELPDAPEGAGFSPAADPPAESEAADVAADANATVDSDGPVDANPAADAGPSAGPAVDADGAPADGPTASDPEAGPTPDEPGSAPFTGSGDREDDSPDLAELRAELNDQFESIKIVERGKYDLNLMELYDREEYIISLMEDGRYAIEVPETWRGDD